MIDPEPAWRFQGANSLAQWYGHVRVWGNYVLGQWVCLDGSTGTLRWEKKYFRPNTIVDVRDGVIVATEMRSDGPWTATFGCYGISVETGELLWISHANGWYGKLLRLLDGVPLFTNELRDDPLAVEDGRVLTRRGRLLNLQTGRCEARDKSRARAHSRKSLRSDPDHQLYYAHPVPIPRAIGGVISTCPPGKTLRPDQIPGVLHGPYDVGFYRYTEKGDLGWSKKISDLNYYTRANFFSYRFRDPYIYCVVSEDRIVVPRDPGKPYLVRKNPSIYRMVVIHVDSGEVMQDLGLTEEKVTEARIETIAEDGILLSVEGRELRFYRWAG